MGEWKTVRVSATDRERFAIGQYGVCGPTMMYEILCILAEAAA